MKKTAILLIAILYTIASSGVIGSNFYCCGKFKESSLFFPVKEKKGCKKDTENDGCCNTKTFFAKVSDQHAASPRIKVNHDEKIIDVAFLPSSLTYENSQNKLLTSCVVHAPPLA